MSSLFINCIFLIFICLDGVVRVTGSAGVYMTDWLKFQSSEIVGMVFVVEKSGVSIANCGNGYNILVSQDFKVVFLNFSQVLLDNILMLFFFLFFLFVFICFNVGYFSNKVRFFYFTFIHLNFKVILFLSHFRIVSLFFNKINSFFILMFGESLDYKDRVIGGRRPSVSIYWHDHYITTLSKTFLSDFIVHSNYLIDDSNYLTGFFYKTATNPCVQAFCRDNRYDYLGSDYLPVYKMDKLDFGKWFVTKDDLDSLIYLIYCVRFGGLFLLEDVANVWSKFLLPFTSYASCDFKYCARFFVYAHWVDFSYRRLFLQLFFSFTGVVFFFLKSFSTSLYFFYVCLICFSLVSLFFFFKSIGSSGSMSFGSIASKSVSLFKRYTLIYILLFLFPFLYGFVGLTLFLFSLVCEYIFFFYKHYYETLFMVGR